jgi:hypothetical protein
VKGAAAAAFQPAEFRGKTSRHRRQTRELRRLQPLGQKLDIKI